MIAAAIGISLAGCATDKPAIVSLQRGAAEAFVAPTCAVQGRTRRDQQWIDGQVEAGIAAFHWKRPKACPADVTPAALPLPPKKKPLWRRLIGR